LLMVSAWGYFLVQGVKDPLGGINSLWPLFGVANQMLAAIALCLGTTIILKMSLRVPSTGPLPSSSAAASAKPNPALALITALPLAWLVAVTFTAGFQKIYHSDPRIGFLAQARALNSALPALESKLEAAKQAADETAAELAGKAIRSNRTQRFNNLLDAAVANIFLVLVSAILLLSVREWRGLLSGRRAAVLHESEPVWLEAHALKEGPGFKVVGSVSLALALARELSGEAQLDRAQELTRQEPCCRAETAAQVQNARPLTRKEQQETYLKVSEERFRNIRRCC